MSADAPHIDPTAMRRARLAAGLTREDVAVAIGKSFSTVVNYESGRSRPASEVVVVRWARACGVTPDDLLVRP
jgi:transcriptional regulator with XRE-family HTH domain